MMDYEINDFLLCNIALLCPLAGMLSCCHCEEQSDDAISF